MFITYMFSPSMLPDVAEPTVFSVKFVGPFTARQLQIWQRLHSMPAFTSAIDRADIAAVIAADLGVPLTANQVKIDLSPGDIMVVAVYRGPRMPRGTTQLPEGARIRYCVVQLLGGEDDCDD